MSKSEDMRRLIDLANNNKIISESHSDDASPFKEFSSWSKVSEAGMPSSVIKSKEKIRYATDEENKQRFAGKTLEELRSMAWRHGYGKGSKEYDKFHDGITGVPEKIEEDLHKWFKEKWVRFGPDGKIRGDCARDDDSEGKPKCLPQSKAHNLGKKDRASAASRKRREDPNADRSGKAINVNTKKKKSNEGKEERCMQCGMTNCSCALGKCKCKCKPIAGWIPNKGFEKDIDDTTLNEKWSQKYKSSINCSHPKGFSQKAHCAGKKKYNESIEMEMVCEDCGMCQTHGDHTRDLDEACWKGYHKDGMKTMFGKKYPNCVKNTNEEQEVAEEHCPHCGGPMYHESMMNEKQDACYHKVKSRYKVWPSAYASGALVQCRKKGAANWGNKSESVMDEEQLDEKCWDGYEQAGMKKKGNKMVPNCIPEGTLSEDEYGRDLGALYNRHVYGDDEDEDEEQEDYYDYDDEDRIDFMQSGSALRAASHDNPRDQPCPSCDAPNRLTPADVELGYQCNDCADKSERGYD